MKVPWTTRPAMCWVTCQFQLIWGTLWMERRQSADWSPLFGPFLYIQGMGCYKVPRWNPALETSQRERVQPIGHVPLTAIAGTWWPIVQSKHYNSFNSSPPGQNGRYFPDDIFKCIFMNEKFCILIWISLKFVPKGPINNIPALVQIMAWRRSGVKPLSEPMLT